MIGKLEYCGGGQIRDAKTKQLVSPREIVQAWNESLDRQTAMRAELHTACLAMHEEGDDTLCESHDCPYYGEPNGCNHPKGGF